MMFDMSLFLDYCDYHKTALRTEHKPEKQDETPQGVVQ